MKISPASEAPHYLVITVGTTGDIHPMMSLAKGLQALGRQVTFITHSFHAPLLRQAGIPCMGLGSDEEYLRLLNNPDIWDAKKSFGALLSSGYREGLAQLLDLLRSLPPQTPKVVISHPFLVPGAAMARELGLVDSVVAAYLAPSNLKTCFDPLTIGPTSVPTWVPMAWRRALWRHIEKGWIDPVALAQVNGLRRPLGLTPVRSFLGHIAAAPDLSLTLFPSWFAPRQPDWPQALIEGDFQLFEAGPAKELDEELSAWLAAGERPLVFTPGTGNLHAEKFFACALAATQKLGARAIFLSKERAQIPAHLPDSVRWQAYVPLATLLPRARALIHHGGIGTTAEALRCGTPQLLTPFAWDQFDNAARVAALGVGRVIPAKRLTAAKLAGALAALSTLSGSASVQARCAQVASHFDRRADASALCSQIEHCLLTSSKQPSAVSTAPGVFQ
ncbi:glycosyltransferase [Paucibacter sp. TC2R-5]|uniref:glycosyltransferase n=1 Tax=Paucibacter sp. TC2R-5 TaxID=2893555 RepID=UPI0021E49284|nr:glycosyltransferase [Paucibacter sp. TC2R-5]MCV2358767.1 glycosyltransferase [Paucibacter sp. TC2R-5]